MPYTLDRSGKRWVVKKKDTGEVVARPKTLSGAKGYMWHAEHGKRKRKGRGDVVAPARME